MTMTQLESADRTLRLLERGLAEASDSARLPGPEPADQTLQWFSVPAPLLNAEALLDAAPHQDACYWSGGRDEELVGVGVARRLTGRGAERFAHVDEQLQRLWADLVPRARGESNSPEPRVVGGFAFQPGRANAPPWQDFGEAQFILPRLAYTRREDRAWLTLTASPRQLASATERTRWLNEIAGLVTAADAQQRQDSTTSEPTEISERTTDEWRQLLADVQGAIREGCFQKVVLARRVLLRFERELSPARALARLRTSEPNAPRFAFRVSGATFLGSPPERLLAKNGLHIETEAVAGSLPATDEGATERLLSDAKLLSEHAPVVQDLVERLRPVAELSAVPERPRAHRARHILHLKTPISATLRSPERALSLLSRIHPTPAVGGYPTAPALRWIAEHEPEERGWYGGPIGWIDSQDNADFAVALRSGVVMQNEAYLYVGAGIVQGSDADSELQETRWKLKVLLSALGPS
jgi:isochorismate synthase